MALLVSVAAQQFHPLQLPQQPAQVSFFRTGAGKVWRAVVWSAKESFSKISSVFFLTIGFIYPKLSSTLESIGFFMFDLSTKVGGVLFLRQRQNQIEDLQNENTELAARVVRLQQDTMNLLEQRNSAWAQSNRMQAERNQVTQERDLLQENYDRLQRENAQTVEKLDFEVQRRKLSEQDHLLLGRERELALAQQDRLQQENDALVRNLEEVRAARDVAIPELPQMSPGLAGAVKQLQALVEGKPSNWIRRYS